MRRLVVDSSVIRSVGYDARQRILEIAFVDGHIYQYADVPPEVAPELIDAGSIGRYFREHIRDDYTYRRVTRPRARRVRRRDPDAASLPWRRRARPAPGRVR